LTRSSSVPPPVTAVLDAGATWLPRRLAAIERLLEAQSGGHGPILGADATATLSAGGKRLRPLLVLLCAGPLAGEEAVRGGAAIELVHMATLVHDDVLDDAPLRRGRPTIAATGGRGRATAAGDLLFSRAFALLAAAEDRGAIALLSDASLALARGELAQRRSAYDAALPEERYLQRCRLKTARLFECACLLGRTRIAEDKRARDGLRAFGAEVGLAFQLLDDILDVEGPPERTGKARGTDLLDGTVTLPLIWAAESDPGLAGVDLRSLDPASAEALCERIAATGATQRVRERALGMVAAGKRELDSAGLETEQRRLLDLVADGVLHVGALQCLQLSRQLPRAEVELLVIAVDLALAMHCIRGPLAIRAPSPDAPASLGLRLLPARGLDEVRAAGGADVQPLLGGGGLTPWNAHHAFPIGCLRGYLKAEAASLAPQNP